MVINPHALGFLPKSASGYMDSVVLDTTFNPYTQGSSLIHLDHSLYSETPDFIFTPSGTPGKKLEDFVAAYGNVPGNGMGPKLRSILETLGYIFSAGTFFIVWLFGMLSINFIFIFLFYN